MKTKKVREHKKEREHLAFKINGDVQIRADWGRQRAIISCVTDDGKALSLETDYQTLDRIHQQIQTQLQR